MDGIGPVEAVRLAKESLGAKSTEELAAHILANYGIKLKPALVTVLLGSLQERENLRVSGERAKQEAARLAEMPVVKPKREKRQGPRDGGTHTAAELQVPKACPACNGDYSFRGRKLIREPEKPELVETKYKCRACECEWKVRVPAEVVGPLGARKPAEDETTSRS